MKKLPSFALAAGLLTFGFSPINDVHAQQSGYSKWTDPSAPSADGKLQGFVDKLNKLVDEAEKARAADPNFLRDLRNLARGYDRPWQTRVFNDQFLDGEFRADPVWLVTQGKYWVERGWGLRSAVKPGQAAQTQTDNSRLSSEEKAAQIFGQILNQALGGKSQQTANQPAAPTAAIIHSAANISNAFAMEMDVSSWSTSGQLQIAVYQGKFQNQQSFGYRLAYRPGGSFELTRISSRGSSVVERSREAMAIEDKQIHRLQWERYPDGRMTVAVDGKQVIDTVDRGFRDAFSGVALINTGGDYIIKGVTVAGTR